MAPKATLPLAVASSSAAGRSLLVLTEINPELAAKVQPATGQQMLALGGEGSPVDHRWRYLGNEKQPPRAQIDECLICSAIRRTVRRFQRALVTYARSDGETFARARPSCRGGGRG